MNSPEAQFRGNTEMHRQVREFDWASTPFGPIEEWSTSLVSLVRSTLASNFPSVLHWGRDYLDIFNDAYVNLIAPRVPVLGHSSMQEREDWAKLKPIFDTILDNGESLWAENSLFASNRNGSIEETYFTASYSPAFEDDGSISGVQLTCYEVTNQVINERRLNLLHALAQVTESGKGPIELAKRIGKLCARYPSDIPILLLFMLDEEGTLKIAYETQHVPEPDMRIIGKALEGLSFDLDVEYRKVTAGPFDQIMQRATIAPMFSRAGAVIGVIILGVSPARPYDDTYRSFFELLRRQISIALDNSQQLETARKRAAEIERLDRLKTNLFNNMSHEMRTPMNAIVGGSSLLLDANLPDDQHDLVEMINSSAAHLIGIINDVLDFSKLDSNNVEYASDPFDLSALVDEAINLVSMQAARVGSSIIRMDNGTLPKHVIGDKTRVRQVLLNLLSNAAKFTDLGTIEVRTNYNGTCLQLEVADTGIGIPADKLDAIFDVFSQVDRRVSTGAGIGLSITRSLVRGMGGEIGVESTEGVGTTFRVRIPMAMTNDEPVSAGSTKVSKQFAVEHPLSILIAEDNVVNQKILGALLGRLGYESDVVADGLEAVKAAQTGKYNVILMDVQMPKMDGLEAAGEITRSMTAGTAPRIIAVTANAKSETDNEAADAGMVDYITKPVTIPALMHVLLNASRDNSRAEQQKAALDTARLSSLPRAALSGLMHSWLESTVVLLSQAEVALDDDNHSLLTKIMKQIVSSSTTIGATDLVDMANRYLQTSELEASEITTAYKRIFTALQRYND